TWTNTMVIDCGVNQGLKKYMPVIVPEGLVGFVSEVYTESARVQLLIDPRTMVGGIIQRPASRVASMVSGNTGKLGVLSFVNIVKEDDVIKGDVVITSGYGGVYPKGLVIGSIQQVTDDSGKLSLDADIKPAVDFGHLEEVFVIMDSIRKTLPQNIDTEVIQREPPMNPNLHQAGAENE
ncbi:rod shape-determining protein MreC, partial [Dialister invisus]